MKCVKTGWILLGWNWEMSGKQWERAAKWLVMVVKLGGKIGTKCHKMGSTHQQTGT